VRAHITKSGTNFEKLIHGDCDLERRESTEFTKKNIQGKKYLPWLYIDDK